MPVTPFHFGPGLALKGVVPRSTSFTAFIAANVLIDCESLYYLALHEYPVHRQLHTFIGAAVAGLVIALVLLGVRRLLRGWLAAHVQAELSVRGIWIGAIAGALSHPILDGIMHPDIQPFQPFTTANPLHELISLGGLHGACVVAGLLGLLLLLIRSPRTASR